ncbi:MAG: type 4a pilus biogenesis protein PilO [Deltaproteobacteria bacterium]|jgi:Tfp pilus assembly protein PilO|nr:type 4a pilus biogenesis protein PilO [Deltaproteobacteria bacterium]
MSRSQKRNIFYTIIIIGVWFYFVFWQPVQQKNLQLDEELAQKQTEEKVYQAQIKKIEAVMKAFGNLYRDYTFALNNFTNQQKLVPDIPEEISRQAQTSKLNIAAIETLPEVKKDDIFIGGAKVSATGTYAQALKFVSGITNSERYINFNEFNFNKFPEGTKENKSQILKVNFVLEYYRTK